MTQRIDYPDLPVAARRAEILAALARHRILILSGETGSGKTTQVPKMALEWLGDGGGLIGCTQPRRIAARAVAARLAQELKCELGGLVGYKVRFSDKVQDATRIKVMTDGILLAESQSDPLLRRYRCLIVDEAHERSLNIDFLLGYLKDLLDRRSDLSLVITSATIDIDKFSTHFGGAPTLEVSGRTYPVEIRWRPPERPTPAAPAARGKDAKKDEPDLMQGILDAGDELARLGPGDTLVFLPGEREIRDCAEALRKHHPPGTEILPLFARLSVEEQDRIFKPHGARRIVLATNVAETSLTVPGIRYVIDTGLARVKRYSARNKVEQLLVEKISQASANQRAGRCGRVEAGVCIRLYDEEDYANRPRYTDPELLRSSLAGVILRMKELGLGDPAAFPFIDPPQPRLLHDGEQLLQELHALDEAGRLTAVGKKLARLPLDPRIARMVLESDKRRCLSEALVIASALSVQDPRERPLERQAAADEKHRQFADEKSDFLGWLKLWEFFDEAIRHKKSNRQLNELLQDNFLSPRRMREWRDIHGQLFSQVTELGLKPNDAPPAYVELHKALLAGLLGNAGFKSDDAKAQSKEGMYQGTRGIRFNLHPASVLAKKPPKWIMSAELTDTGRLLARTNAVIEPEWLEEMGTHLVSRSHTEPHWEKARGYVAAYEKVTLYGLTIVARRKVHYGPLDPKLCRELFIRAALVAGDYDSRAPWFVHNRQLVNEVEALEHKARRSGVWLDEERMFRFFDARIPEQVHNATAFERWLREEKKQDALKLTLEDMVGEGFSPDHALFPEEMTVDGVSCKQRYRFEPGHPLDGVTLTLPLYLLNRIPQAQVDWLVPGLIREKITTLLKGLPKALRQPLMPLPEAVTAFLSAADTARQPLPEALAAFVTARAQQKVSPADFAADLPPHLLLNLRVIDDAGQELALGRDLAALRRQLGDTARLAYGRSDDEAGRYERSGITAWDFGELPESVQFKRAGKTLTGYPALLDENDSVALRLLDDAAAAAAQSRDGVVRLLRLALAPQMKQLEKELAQETALALKYRALGSADAFRAAMLDTVAERALLGDDELPRRQKDFEKQRERAKPRIPVVARALKQETGDILDLYNVLLPKLQGQGPLRHALADEREHLARLVHSGFLRDTPWARLHDLGRYLKGIARRLDKLPGAMERDRRHTAAIRELEQAWADRMEKQRKAGTVDAALADFRWQLEELRISLFAQELKTPYPVSVKRLQKLWQEIGHD